MRYFSPYSAPPGEESHKAKSTDETSCLLNDSQGCSPSSWASHLSSASRHKLLKSVMGFFFVLSCFVGVFFTAPQRAEAQSRCTLSPPITILWINITTGWRLYYDYDNDGYGTNSICSWLNWHAYPAIRPFSYHTAARGGDCNDRNASIHPGRAEVCDGIDNNCRSGINDEPRRNWYYDRDRDGYGSTRRYQCASPGFGWITRGGDCNDGNRNIRPGAREVCNGIDDDCDRSVDEGIARRNYYQDADRDGYGNSSRRTYACRAPGGYVTRAGDCNDSNRYVYPGRTEACNGVDDDCDGSVDEGLRRYYYYDNDSDGWGNSGRRVHACSQPSRYTTRSGDCNDSNRAIYPGAREACDNQDNDCDGSVDEGITRRNYYQDADLDGYGNSSRRINACRAPGGYVTRAGDCNDSNRYIYPGRTETCNNIDDDCDGSVDEGLRRYYYYDNDNDGWGNSGNRRYQCSSPGSRWLTRGGDCNDNNRTTYPGAREICDSVDNDCDSSVDEGVRVSYYRDADRDGYGRSGTRYSVCANWSGYSSRGGDCNDGNTNINPGRSEICGNNLDDNCNGSVDENRITYYRDNDGDSYGSSTTTRACSRPNGYATRGGDCNDGNRNINPSRSEVCNGVDDNCRSGVDEGLSRSYLYRDNDRDGYGTGSRLYICARSGFSSRNGDCNDGNANINPGRTEICGNNVDDNCNGGVDENTRTFYRDADNDGWGLSSSTVRSCSQPSGYTTRGGDCNDGNRSVYPGANEVCNYRDDDCDGSVDEGLRVTRYRDNDRDGYGTSSTGLVCANTAGWASQNGDCNDSNANVNPGRAEVCGNSVDDNCDGSVDENLRTFYRDNDGDTYGASSTRACAQPAGYTTRGGDCNDGNPTINPGRTEVCNGVDDNCRGGVDEGLRVTRYRDNDRDTYGTTTANVCPNWSGYATRGGDCNDGNANINPGRSEVCNGVDDNCRGGVDEGLRVTRYRDADGDGYGGSSASSVCASWSGYVTNSSDCNDGNANINPGASEICGNNVDDNCSGSVDENVITCYRDADSDGYGNNNVTVRGCSCPSGYVRNNTDCNDNNASARPGGAEVCDGVDNDCDGSVDEGLTVRRYRDADGDSYGTYSRNVCPNVGGWASQNGDCNDGNANINPGASEICGNSVDDNCNGSVDENRVTWYRDTDSDGYGASGATLLSCTQPTGYTNRGGDCNDNDADINPGEQEVCDNKDNDCDSNVDEGLRVDRYRDNDRDGYGAGALAQVCPAWSGWASRDGDCNDGNANINPGRTEVCDNIDNNCNGSTDEGLRVTRYLDADRDTYGGRSAQVCPNAPGYAARGGDCNDLNASVNPGLSEVCGNNIDDNCDGSVDENRVTYYRDADNDTYGTNTTIRACSRPNGYAVRNGDCNDGNASVNPGRSEICNGVDDNCRNGVDEGLRVTRYRDNDRDGYGTTTGTVCPDAPGWASLGNDCDDNRASVNPGASEVCGNNLDDNCNGSVDENRVTYYRDADNDTYGTSVTTRACARPAGYATRGGDCNDSNSNVNPGRTEACNSIDDNCDGSVDEGLRVSGYRDNDRDSYGAGSRLQICAGWSGYATRAGDCNDGNSSINPGATEVCDNIDNDCDSSVDEGLRVTRYRDADNDNYGTSTTANVCPGWSGYATQAGDCNDSNANINPGESEVCGNGIDDNCNGSVDENRVTYYRDADNDTYGNANNTQRACTQPSGFVARGGDCNDGNSGVNPGATESCNGVDDDCDGSTDEGLLVSRYRDADNDNYGTSATGNVCPDAVGWATNNGDCNDANASVNPGETEVCGNNLDDNCNGSVDENTLTYYRDADSDTYGDTTATTRACTEPTGFVARGGDCNDSNATINPGRTEVCNNLDDNCDGSVDEGLRVTRYRDADGDSFGSTQSASVCPQWGGWTNNNTDCNDGDAAIYPGATEVCGNAEDDNCDGQVDENTFTFYLDADGDGFGSRSTLACARPAGYATQGGDCNDGNANINPGATEVCNSLDDNCNNVTDEGLRVTRYRDNDGDGFGSSSTALVCPQWGGYAENSGDCDDSRDYINPAAPELCGNNLDDNCNSQVDENRILVYRDFDGDNFGNPNNSTLRCSPGGGYVRNNTDCNDGSSSINPGAAELCNNIDDNCSGQADEGNPQGGQSCTSGLPGACAETSTTACNSGQVVCAPVEPDAYGTVSTVNVPGGILGRGTAAINSDWKLISSNGTYLFNLAYGRQGSTYNGYTVQILNPSDNFSVVKRFEVGDSSLYIDGISVKGDILYAYEWTGANPARVVAIDWRREQILNTVTHSQGSTQAIEGQYDWVNDVFWMASLRFNPTIYEFSTEGVENANLVRSFNAEIGAGLGAGTIATDGRFLYIKRWASYPGIDNIVKIGTGYGNTVRGFNYGTIANVPRTISTTYHSDGFLYVASPDDGGNTLTRIRVTDPRQEICGDGIDNNCNGGVDDYCPAEDPFDDFESGLVACNWNVVSSHGSATLAGVENGVLKTRLNTPVSGQAYYRSGLTSRFALSGDFDVTVKYRITDWEGEGGVRINLAAAGGVVHRLNERSNNEHYITNLGGTIGTPIPTNDTEGTLRLVRTGSTIIGYYANAGWREVGRRSGMNTGATPIELSIHGHGALPGNIEVEFDDFTVNSGTVSTPPGLGAEVCDGEDNDCDGEVDEEANVACSTLCGVGVRVCQDGALLACDAREPSAEVCDDSVDNDCNGEVDEGCSGFNPVDDFDDNNLSSCRWELTTAPSWQASGNTGTRVDEEGGTLRMRVGAGTRGANFSASSETRFGVEGDFDVQVDYHLSNWPSNSHIRVGFLAAGASIQRTGDRGVGESYVSTFQGATAGRTANTATSGRLRLIRTGGTVRTFVQNGGNWTLNATGSGNTDTTPIRFAIWGHDYVTGDVEVRFDNLQFNGCNEAPCRTWPGGRLVNFGGLGSPEGADLPSTCDAIDNDCDGITDGFQRSCSTACGDGMETCNAGSWESCTAQVPITEICDGQDNDCDGDIDEEDPNEGSFCTVSGAQGVCAQGTRVCRGAQGLVCEGASPGPEVCDGLDNDCDGSLDETGDAPDLFSSDSLVGYWSFEERTGSTFRDNAGDNNAGTVFRDARLGVEGRYGYGLELDGSQDYAQVDTSNAELTISGDQITVAAWLRPDRHTDRAFTVYRNGGFYLTLIDGAPGFYAYGLSDPGYHTAPQALPLDQWSFVAATYDGSTVRLFVNNTEVYSVAVTGNIAAGSGDLIFGHNVTTNNTALDGVMDEVFLFRQALTGNELRSISQPEMPGGGVACDTGEQGVCSAGSSVCSAGQFTCNGPAPEAEVCDGLDNNCDGTVDEGNPQGGGTCLTSNPGICRTGSWLCSEGGLICDAPQPGENAEVCDGQDNDCDGGVDEVFPGQGSGCTVPGARGVCASGALTCVAGTETCVGPEPETEVCDNFDNDCDGETDETLTRACSSICGGGVETCEDGEYAGCTARLPTPEICDGLDNDCDGQTDESIIRTCQTSCGGGTEVCVLGEFTACSAPRPSAELCDGFDNDCNGFIDDAVDCGCQYFPEDEPVQPSLEWMWTGSDVEPDSNQVIMTPMVANLDDDNNDNVINTSDTPDVVFVTVGDQIADSAILGGTLRVISGDTGAEKWSHTGRQFYGGSSPAIGDLNNDGTPEIVAYSWRDGRRGAPNDSGLVALDNQGNELWSNADVNRGRHFALGAPAIANIDRNSPGNEIATCFALIAADGRTLWDDWDNLPPNHSPRGFCAPAVADVDGDNEAEIVIGARAYNHDGTVLWTNTLLYANWILDYDIAPAIADLDGDGNPEVIVVRGRVHILDAATGNELTSLDLPAGGQGGAPNVADFDGDGLPEIGVANSQFYSTMKARRVAGSWSLQVMWQTPVRDHSSGVSGSSVFDFNGDGIVDVVYNDELHFRVLNGRNGQVVFEERNASGTLVEYPVIVDVDNDDNAEIIVVRNDIGDLRTHYADDDGTPRAGIRVYGDANDNWVNTRKIWNQYAYHITNVGDNGSIPASEVDAWQVRTSNNYRTNFQGGQGLFAAPDLTVAVLGQVVQGDDNGNFPGTDVPYCPARNTASLRLCNEGDAVISQDVEVEIYAGDPNHGGTLVASEVLDLSLDHGDSNNCTEVEIAWNSQVQGTYRLFAVVDTAAALNECDEDNNQLELGEFAFFSMTEEKCDGIDEDCDGSIDEDEAGDPLARACSNICGAGQEFCADGAWGECNTPEPTPEVCDGIDNDCNETVDDGACLGGAICRCTGGLGEENCACIQQQVVGGECAFGCPLGTICSEDETCVPYCESDNACPSGEVCGDDNVCVLAAVTPNLGEAELDQDRELVETPLGACSSGSFAKGAGPLGGLGFLILLMGLVAIRRKPESGK